MSKKQRKNGFTLVELAIVIAVIAILIAVLVPTFTALISKANQSSDSQLVSNLNTSITSDQAINGEYDNATEAITALREDGYDLSKLTPTADGADIVYNASTHLFVYYTDDFAKLSYGEVNSGDTLVVITDGTLSRAAEASVLSNTIEYCVYSTSNVTVNTESNSYANGATIYVYTESGSSTINATNVSTVNRYGASAADEVSVAVTSYHLYGSVETLTLQKGHVELTADAVVEDLIVTKADTSGTQKVTYVKGAELTNIVDENETSTACTCVYKTSESDTTETAITVSELCEETGVTEAITVTGVDGYGTETNPYEVASVDDFNNVIAEDSTTIYVKLASSTYTITGNFVIPAGKTVTIDLNSHTVTGAAGTSDYKITSGGSTSTANCTFLNYGILTITGSGNVNCYGTGIDAAVSTAYGASTYIDGGTYTQGKWYLLHNYGYTEINDAIIIGSSSESSVVHNGYQAYSSDCNGNSEAVMVINGMSFGNETEAISGSSSLIKNDDMGILTINDGIFKNAPAWIVLNWNVCTINGGTFSGKEACISCYGNNDDIDKGILTINGGTFINEAQSYPVIYAETSTVTINDGIFKSAGVLLMVRASACIYVKGGTFTQTVNYTYAFYFQSNSASIILTGGTINYYYYIGYSTSITDNSTCILTNEGATLNEIVTTD